MHRLCLLALLACSLLFHDVTASSLRRGNDVIASLANQERELQSELSQLRAVEEELERRDEAELMRRSWSEDLESRSAEEPSAELQLARRNEAELIALNEAKLVRRAWSDDNHWDSSRGVKQRQVVLRQTPIPYKPRYTPAPSNDLVYNNGDFIIRLPNTPAPPQDVLIPARRPTPAVLRPTPAYGGPAADVVYVRPTPVAPRPYVPPNGVIIDDDYVLAMMGGRRPLKRGREAAARRARGHRWYNGQ